MDIKWNMALLSMRADRFWKKTDKKITIQGSNVAGFDKSKVECFNCHKMGHFARECRAPRSQDRGKGPVSESSAKKKGMTVVITTEDMQKRRNDVKARTTLLLALHDEHQLRFSKRQAIVSHLEFMDVEIEQDDLNHKFLTSLAPEWLMYTIVWRNINYLDTMSLDDVYNHLKVYEPEVQKRSELNSQNMAFISSSNTSSGKGEVHTASIQVSTASTDVAAASLSHDTVCAYIASQSNECRAPRSQDRERREGYKQGPKEEEPAPKALMAIDGIECDWSYMATEEENHALVADDKALTEFTLMAKSSSSSKNEVKARLDEFKEHEIKFCEKIKGLERDVEVRNNKIEYLMNELKQVKKEKEGLDNKLTGFENASKDLDNLLGSQRLDKNKEGLGYNAIPPPPAQVNSPPKKDLSWTGLPEFVDDTVTDYSRPTPSIDTSKRDTSDLKSSNFSVFKLEESSGSIMSKPMIKFVKAADYPRVMKTNNTKKARESTVKYAEMYKNTSKSPKVRGGKITGVMMGRRLISWQCKKQTIVATSTTEAEYVTAASGCGQVLWIQNQMLDYG
nr:putative ribonuclease H-like domain-containing protein [Tanacetum cinerariifolium]